MFEGYQLGMKFLYLVGYKLFTTGLARRQLSSKASITVYLHFRGDAGHSNSADYSSAAPHRPLAALADYLSSLSTPPHGRRHLRQEPDAGNPLVRIRGRGQARS